MNINYLIVSYIAYLFFIVKPAGNWVILYIQNDFKNWLANQPLNEYGLLDHFYIPPYDFSWSSFIFLSTCLFALVSLLIYTIIHRKDIFAPVGE